MFFGFELASSAVFFMVWGKPLLVSKQRVSLARLQYRVRVPEQVGIARCYGTFNELKHYCN